MKKIAAILFLVLVLMSCASESQQIGLDKISNHYGTKASYTKSFNTSNGKKTTLFTVKVESNALLDSLNASATLANIALMMYDNFTEEERSDYTNIAVELNNSVKTQDTLLYYEPAMLTKALSQAAIFTDFSEKLIQKDYKGVVGSLRPEFQDEKVLIGLTSFCKTLEKDHGEIVNYKRLSSGTSTANNGEKLFMYIGHLEFADGHQLGYSVRTSMKTDDKYIASYKINPN